MTQLGAALAVLATVCFNPVPAHAQVIAQPSFDTKAGTDVSSLRAPGERDIYSVDTGDWDFSEPGMNKNNVDNHYLEQVLPADLGEPQPEITPGKMRSDLIQLPEGVTKEQADKAEVAEARRKGIYPPGEEPRMRPLQADNCRSYWPSDFQVCGAIRAKYESMATMWAGDTPVSFLGLPVSNELTNPDGIGKRTQFQNGFIYWHPDTGAWSVTTHNSLVWHRNGWEAGRLGYPTSDEISTGDGVGRKQFFQKGRIYGSPVGVASIEGKILEKWIETGEEIGPLGYPTTDEEGTPDGAGRFNRFALGMIYWHPEYGAHPISGLPLFKWSREGFERSKFGYPTGDPMYLDSNIVQHFSGGKIDLSEIIKESPPSNELNSDSKEIVSSYLKYSAALHYGLQQLFPSEFGSVMNTRRVADTTSDEILVTVIPVPPIYLETLGQEPIRRHDYCTYVPDEYRTQGPNADFRGPCARHDMCFDKADAQGEKYAGCNYQLKLDALFVCDKVHSGQYWNTVGCNDAAEVLHIGTNIGNLGHLR